MRRKRKIIRRAFEDEGDDDVGDNDEDEEKR